jgi:hypothetical protein
MEMYLFGFLIVSGIGVKAILVVMCTAYGLSSRVK